MSLLTIILICNAKYGAHGISTSISNYSFPSKKACETYAASIEKKLVSNNAVNCTLNLMCGEER